VAALLPSLSRILVWMPFCHLMILNNLEQFSRLIGVGVSWGNYRKLRAQLNVYFFVVSHVISF
jgi:hypothetical protein